MAKKRIIKAKTLGKVKTNLLQE